MKNIRVLELFAGVGTQSMALKRLANDYKDFNYEAVGIAEIDKFAIQSYNAIHGDTVNFGDVSKVEASDIPDFDLLTTSSPCQDFSLAGKQRGGNWQCLDCGTEFNPIDSDFKAICIECGSENIQKTRSSLLFECARVIEAKKPKYILLENVEALVHKKHIKGFEKWQEYLASLGYTNYAKVLNAKDFGIPQNRKRIFMVSILGEHDKYEFPKGFDLDIRLKDLLESNPEERFFLKDEVAKKFKWKHTVKSSVVGEVDLGKFESRNRVHSVDGTSPCIISTGPPNIITLGNTSPSGHNATRVISPDGISCTVMENHGKGVQILEVQPTNKSNPIEPDTDVVKLIGSTQKNAFVGDGSICNTLTSSMGTGGGHIPMIELSPSFRIRKLTPLETWRLMGISDEDFYKAKDSGVSNSQLYKQSGNAIVVDVLYNIFKNMFIEN